MNLDEKKEYLSGYLAAERREKYLRSELKVWEERATRCTKDLSGASASGKPKGNANYVVIIEKIDKIKTMITAQINATILERQKIVTAIDCLENETQRELIMLRYVAGLNWDEIADELNYSKVHLHRLHRDGLGNCAVPLKPLH